MSVAVVVTDTTQNSKTEIILSFDEILRGRIMFFRYSVKLDDAYKDAINSRLISQYENERSLKG